jgi:hypothetical protein
MRGSRSLVEHARLWVQRHYAALLDKARHAQQKVVESPKRWTGVGIVLAVALLLAVNARGILRWVRELRLRRHPEQAPQLAAALWYQRMIRKLAHLGWKKTVVQTPQEFLTRIEDPEMRERVEKFTRAYEAARFGESPEEAGRLPELYEEITNRRR